MVSFGEAVKSFFVKGFDFKTRSTRAEYWWVVLFNILVSVLMGPLTVFLAPLLGFLVLALAFVPVVIGYLFIPLTVRRFHDIGHSGKWLLIYLVLGVIQLIYWFYLVYTLRYEFAGIDTTDDDDAVVRVLMESGSEHALPYFVMMVLAAGIAIWFFVWSLLPSTLRQTKWDGSVSSGSVLPSQQGYATAPTAPYGNAYNGPLDFAATSAVKAEIIRDESEDLSYVTPGGSETTAKSAGPVLPPAPIVYPPGHPLAPSTSSSAASDQPSGWVRPVVEREEEEFNESGERVEKEPEIIFPLEGFTPPALTENPFK